MPPSSIAKTPERRMAYGGSAMLVCPANPSAWPSSSELLRAKLSELPKWGASKFPGWDAYDHLPVFAIADQAPPNQHLDDDDPMLVNQLLPHDLGPLTHDGHSAKAKGKQKAPAPQDEDEYAVMVNDVEIHPEHLTLSERMFQALSVQMVPFERLAEGINAGPSFAPI